MNEVLGLFLLFLAGCLYFLPAIIGGKTKNAAGILLLNIFLGWTFLGWVIALIWSISSPKDIKTTN